MQLYPPSQEYQPLAETIAEATELLAAYAAEDPDIVMKLIDDDFAAVPGLVLGDLSVASYPGYADKTIALSTFDNVQHESDGSVRVGSTLLATWAGPSSGGAVTIYGHAVVDGDTGARLYRVVHYDTPVVLANNSQFLNVIPILSFTGGYKAQTP